MALFGPQLKLIRNPGSKKFKEIEHLLAPWAVPGGPGSNFLSHASVRAVTSNE